MRLRTLENGQAVIRDRSGALTIAGVTDAAADERGLPPPDIARALAGAPKEVLVILMDHRPGRAHGAAAAGNALQLSGHTHGGMIRGFDRYIAGYNAGLVSGSTRWTPCRCTSATARQCGSASPSGWRGIGDDGLHAARARRG